MYSKVYRVKNGDAIQLVIALLLVSCDLGNPSKDNYTNIRRPNFDLTMRKLVNAGFTAATGDGVDVPILEKHVGDTLIYYQFDNDAGDDSRPLFLMSQFQVPRTDSAEFITSLAFSVRCSNAEGRRAFLIVQDALTNLFYEYSITVKDSSNLFIMTNFEYPLLDL